VSDCPRRISVSRPTKVDAKRVVILIVPTKCRKHHADISPWYGHTRYVRLDESKKGLRYDGNVIKIPGIFGVLIEGVSLHGRHSAASGDQFSVWALVS